MAAETPAVEAEVEQTEVVDSDDDQAPEFVAFECAKCGETISEELRNSMFGRARHILKPRIRRQLEREFEAKRGELVAETARATREFLKEQQTR